MRPRSRKSPSSGGRAGGLLVALLALAVPACADGAAARNDGRSSAQPVAEVGGQPITLAELEEALAPQLTALDRQRRKILEDGLEQVVEERLLETEAKARGVTLEALYRTEIEEKAGEVTEEDALEFYEANRARVGGRTYEQLATQIRQHLAGQRRGELREALLAGLRVKYPTRILFEPERTTVAADGPAKGPANAPITIVEFSDFQCPYCARVNPTIDEALRVYGDRVRVVFRQFPLLSIHPQAQKAAEASLCAHDQGKFWEMHDLLFANQRDLGIERLKAHAAGLGLDAAAFATCLDDGRHAAQVAKDLVDGQAAGVSGTPAMFVNGRFLSGAVPFAELAKLIDDELQRRGLPTRDAG
jgi:protein-disulfide isomerase